MRIFGWQSIELPHYLKHLNIMGLSLKLLACTLVLQGLWLEELILHNL